MATVAAAAADHQGRHEVWDRVDRAKHFNEYRSMLQQGYSERRAAAKIEVPRTTLQAWRAHAGTLDAQPQLVAFFESACGLVFLRRLLAAMHLVFVEWGACGIRLVCQALELAGLDRFISCSYGAQQSVNVAVQESIVGHAKAERDRLALGMPTRDITVAQDETFSGGMTLVAIEPESGFILLEQPSKTRDEAGWNAAMEPALAGLQCNVVQSTSDEAAGLLAYAENTLGAHHSPDLFHIQQELTRGVSGRMAAKERAADKAVTASEVALSKVHAEKVTYETATPADRGPGRPPNWQARIADAEKTVSEAIAERQRIQTLRSSLSRQIRGFGEDYHFADPKTGERSSGSVIERALQKRIYEIAGICESEQLGQAAMQHILKAERGLPKMAATIGFVSTYVRQQVDKLGLGGAATRAFHAKLIPACYLERIARRARGPQRATIRAVAADLIAPLFAPGGHFRDLDDEACEKLAEEADRLAGVFQRSSSCVEGRNGVLAHRHQGLRGIGERKRQCLTALHNFFITRADGTTAAERFFSAKPRDLFHAVLEKIAVPRPKSPPRKDAKLMLVE